MAESAATAVAAAYAMKRDLVWVELKLPGRDGLELIRDLRVSHPEVPVLVLSMHDASLFAERALRAGGRGYISNQQGGVQLVRAIRPEWSGQNYLTAVMSTRFLARFATPGNAPSNPSHLDSSADRELAVFTLL